MFSNAYGEETGMVLIKEGSFSIGESAKLVYLDQFYIDKTEVTQQEFKKIIGHLNFF